MFSLVADFFAIGLLLIVLAQIIYALLWALLIALALWLIARQVDAKTAPLRGRLVRSLGIRASLRPAP